MARRWTTATLLATTATAVLMLPLLATPVSSTDTSAEHFSLVADEQLAALRSSDEPLAKLFADTSRSFVAQQDVSQECSQQLTSEIAIVNSACNTTFAFGDQNALRDPDNSRESHEAADRACAPACQAAWRTMAARLGTCYNSTTVLGNLFERLDSTFGVCTEFNGISCARNMKHYGALTKCSGIPTEAQCTAPTVFGTASCWWGQRNASRIGCHPLHTEQAYTAICACMDRFITANTNRLRLPASLGFSVNDLMRSWDAIKADMCMRVGNTHCYPRVVTPALFQLYGADFSTIPLNDIHSQQRDFCDGVAGQCLAKIVQSNRAASLNGGYMLRKQCTRLCAIGTAGLACRQACADEYLSTVKTGYQLRLDALCGRSDVSPFDSCMRHWHVIHRDPCNATIVGGLCTSSCAQSYSDEVLNTGCCLPVIERAWRNPVPREVMPSAVVGLLPAAWSQSYADSQVRANIESCPLTTLKKESIASRWARCQQPAVSPERTLRLPSLRWSAMQNNEELRARLIEMLKLDVGMASGTPSEDVNGTLTADGHGIKFNFTLWAPSAAKTTIMVQSYDAAVASGSFAGIATASFVADECSACVTGDADAVRGSTLAPSSAPLTSLLTCGGLATVFALLALLI